MKTIKVLNLYACLGGNRYKWDESAEKANVKLEVTAVELDPELARLYQERFPNDKVVITDAHQYLLDHYKEFDFIWSSPPCPSHSRINISQYTRDSWKPRYPDFQLYEEIVFLDNYYKGCWVVENVIPFYEPLIAAQKRHRHLYWTNLNLPKVLSNRKSPDFTRIKNEYQVLSEFHDIQNIPVNAGGYRNVLRNLVDYEAGRTIFETFLNIPPKKSIPSLFDDNHLEI